MRAFKKKISEIVHMQIGISYIFTCDPTKNLACFDVRFSIYLKCPKQPLLRAKPLFNLHNLLHKRKHIDTGTVLNTLLYFFLQNSGPLDCVGGVQRFTNTIMTYLASNLIFFGCL